MAAIRISVTFLISVVLATLGMLVSQGFMPAFPLERQASHESRIITFSEVLGEAKPCGLRPETAASATDLGFSAEYQNVPAPSSAGLYRPLHARDLPGIVKLEPEHDIALTEVAKGHCSATRIADDWFLTAAHCVSSGYDRIVLKVGSESLYSDDIRSVPVDYAVCHAGFRGQNTRYENDISLLHIADENLPSLSDVPVIDWGSTSRPFDKISYRTARVGGWGLKTYKGDLNDHLQKMELDIVTIDPKQISLASNAGRGPCVGDSGGPLIIDDDGKPVLMGVLSTISSNRFGEMCAGRYVSNYTNLTAYRSWVFNIMAVCTEQEDDCRVKPGALPSKS